MEAAMIALSLVHIWFRLFLQLWELGAIKLPPKTGHENVLNLLACPTALHQKYITDDVYQPKLETDKENSPTLL